MKILLVDHHAIMRIALGQIILSLYPRAIINEATTIDEALRLLQQETLQLLILDIELRGIKGPGTISDILQNNPGLKVLAFSDCNDEQTIGQFFQAGINAYISKREDTKVIKTALQQISLGKNYGSKQHTLNTANYRQEKKNIFFLSPRELEVLHLLMQGQSNTDIATLLHIKHSTVSSFKARIFKKMQVTSDYQLVHKYNWMK